MNMNYLGQAGVQVGGQSAQMFLQPVALQQRPPLGYKVGPVPQHVQAHNQHSLLPPVSKQYSVECRPTNLFIFHINTFHLFSFKFTLV